MGDGVVPPPCQSTYNYPYPVGYTFIAFLYPDGYTSAT